MKSGHKGSMILSCMFFISICMVIMLLHWHAQEMTQRTMVIRIQMMQAQYAAEALMQYGINHCKKEYARLAKELTVRGQPLIITFAQWPCGNEQYGQGRIEIAYTQLYTIMATLILAGYKTIKLSCRLEKERGQREIFTVSAWKWYEGSSPISV